MGGPGSGRRPEGGGGGGTTSPKGFQNKGNYNHLKVKMAERNRRYTSSGMPKGGVNLERAKALQKLNSKGKLKF